jgi:hypothetical protein
MDMRRIDDTIYFKGGHAIPLKTTGVSVGKNDHDAEASLPDSLHLMLTFSRQNLQAPSHALLGLLSGNKPYPW